MAKRMPLLERAVGNLTGHALVWLGQRAAKRGDLHEARHCLAAIWHGASEHSKYPCTLPDDDMDQYREQIARAREARRG